MVEQSSHKTANDTPSAGILPASHWAHPDDEPSAAGNDDTSSLYTSDSFSSTTSVASSLRRFRSLHGRTYHSEIGNAVSWTPNDQKHIEMLDLMHATCLTAIHEKLFLAPLDTEKLKSVLDVGTGAGHWAIDMGDLYPNAEVIGTDITPMQPSWVPPNVSFQIDDANLEWTFSDNRFDFVHLRFLVGCITDWNAFYREAFRCTKPGGWIEHFEAYVHWYDDAEPIPEGSTLDIYNKAFSEAGKKAGRTFDVLPDDIQKKGMEAAGFVDIQVKDIKIPFGPWPEDAHEKELGLLAKAYTLADLEGWLVFTFTEILGWEPEYTQVFIAHVRKEINNPKRKLSFRYRVVYGRKPETS